MLGRVVTFCSFICLSVPFSHAERVFEYEEVRWVPAPKPSAASSHGKADMPRPGAEDKALVWKTPAGWSETRGSGMRLATLVVTSADGLAQAECSVITLRGGAGGVSANVGRWMGQMQLSLPADDTMDTFLARQESFTTAGGDKGLLVDLTALQANADPALPSMMVGLVMQQDRTAFFKLTGPGGFLITQREPLLALCRSVE